MSNWIVVGSGSTGGVASVRATESSSVSVTLLEAGPDYPLDLPSDLRNGGHNSYYRHDWRYTHEPSKGQRITFVFPRGRVVGGSSSVNTCIALRGRPYDYDEWDLPDWTFEKCLPFFKRLETDLDFDDEWHGQSGPIRIRRHAPEELVPWQAAFRAAAREHGAPSCVDHNNPTSFGMGPHAMNKVGGERQSVLRCYFTREVRARENLDLKPNTLVRRVLFSNRRVRGVEVECEDRMSTIECERVMLSAGAINTVGILLRSGIGPRATLEKLGVDVIADLPCVGARILDHHGAALFFFPPLGTVSYGDPMMQMLCRFTSEGSPHPHDMQIQAGSITAFPQFTLPLATLMCQVGKPRGTGEMFWDSADPRCKPRIFTHALELREDRDKAIAAIRFAYDISQEPSMRSIARVFWPREKTLLSDKMHDAIRHVCDSGYHPCGTVPMGDDRALDRGEAATDSRGRVRGVSGLYVADASLFPTVPSANTNLTAIMFGERFGEWMKTGALS